jgi:ectoine hydroxylase-related dioxygenase (phytanoyl-CoA dioxygenase family)
MAATHLLNTASAEEVATIVARDGVCIVDRLVDDSVMDRVDREIRPYIESTPRGIDPGHGYHTLRTGALISRSPTIRELVRHPLVLDSVRRVLDKQTRFQLHLTDLISIEPGESAQIVHRDQWAFEFPFPRDYEVMCNTIWALTEFTAENGATRLIPGSNHFDDGLFFEEADTVPAEMARGSVLIYTGSLYHGGGANRSDTTRSGINLTYSAAWLRQEENQYLAVPLEVAQTLDNDLLRLIGYSRAGIGLGTYGDRCDPLDFVKPGEGTWGLITPDEEAAASRAGNPELLMQPATPVD